MGRAQISECQILWRNDEPTKIQKIKKTGIELVKQFSKTSSKVIESNLRAKRCANNGYRCALEDFI